MAPDQRLALAYGVEHPAGRIGIHHIVTDQVVRDSPSAVAPGPFIDVAGRSATADIDGGQQYRVAGLLDQIRKWHPFGIVMIVVTASHDRERAGRSGQQHIGVAAELASPQVNPLMYGSRLVHVIALIGSATGIEKREVSGDQQRRTMMRNGIRPGENGARLAVIEMAVRKKERVLGRESVLDHHALADETAAQHRSGIDRSRASDDEVARRHARSDPRGGLERAVQRSVAERRGSVDRSALSDRDVQQRQRVDHRAAPADRAARCRPALSVPGDQAAQPLDGPSPVTVHGQHVSDLGRQAVVYRDLAPPGFVDRRDLDPVPERRTPVADDLPDVLDHRAVFHVIPGHIASDVGDQHAVAHRTVVKRRTVYAAAADHASRQLDRRTVGAEPDLSAEMSVPDEIGPEAFPHLDRVPRVGRAPLSLQSRPLRLGKLAILFLHTRMIMTWPQRLRKTGTENPVFSGSASAVSGKYAPLFQY